MIGFWPVALVMVMLALALALPAFLRPSPTGKDDSRRDENIAAARARLQELKRRDLSPEELAEYEAEIKSRLLQDADIESDSSPSASQTARIASRRSDKPGAVITFFFLAPCALALFAYFTAEPEHPDLRAAVANLEAHIEANPNDAEALAFMGRVLMATGREDEAAVFFARSEIARAAAEANPQEWNRQTAMARGRSIYVANCVFCHRSNGEGAPPAIPPLSADASIQAQMAVILNGKNQMPSFAHLSDADLAAVITYIRNAWLNDDANDDVKSETENADNDSQVISPEEINAGRE